MKTLFATIFATNKPKRKLALNETHIVHLRNYLGAITSERLAQGGMTVALRVLDNKTVQAAVAVCSGYDNFNRKIGRELALKRLEEKPVSFYYEFEVGEHILELEQYLALEDLALQVKDICPHTKCTEVVLIKEIVESAFLGV